MMNEKPMRCIDPIFKDCQECLFGWVKYPGWVETYEDLCGCTFECGCTLGFDKGRPEDEPTEEELKDYEEWCHGIRKSYPNCTKYMFCAVDEKNKTDEPKMESTSTNRKKPECEIITLWLSDHCTLKPIKSVFLHDCRIIFIGIIQVRTTGYAVDRSGMAVLPHPICTRKSGLFGFCMRHPDIMLRLTGYRHIIGQK